MIFRHICGV